MILQIFESLLGRGFGTLPTNSKFIPTITITSFGDSITVGQNATGNNGYSELLAANYGQSQTNLAVSGRGLWEMANNAFNTPLVSNTTYVTAMAGFNDYRRSGVNAKTDNKLIGAYNSLLVEQFGQSFLSAGTGTTNLTWSITPTGFNATTVGGKYSTAGYITSSAATQSAVYNFTGQNVAVGLIGNSGDLENYGTVKIYIDGVLQSTINTNQLSDNISDGVYDNRRSPYAVTYFGLNNISHSLKLETSIGGYCVIDYFATLNTPINCKPVLLYEIPYMDATGYATAPSSASSNIFASGSLLIKNIVNNYSIAGFPVLYIPTNTYYTASTSSGLSSADHIHPNDTGHAQIENGTITTINNSV